ncbi:MAG: hypothetical protein QM729_21275 [Solirubrobacterales bacterium]
MTPYDGPTGYGKAWVDRPLPLTNCDSDQAWVQYHVIVELADGRLDDCCAYEVWIARTGRIEALERPIALKLTEREIVGLEQQIGAEIEQARAEDRYT